MLNLRVLPPVFIIIICLLIGCKSGPDVSTPTLDSLAKFHTFNELKAAFGDQNVSWVEHQTEYGERISDVHLYRGTEKEIEFVMLRGYQEFSALIVREGSPWTTSTGVHVGQTMNDLAEVSGGVIIVRVDNTETTLPDGSYAFFSGVPKFDDGRNSLLSNDKTYTSMDIKISQLRMPIQQRYVPQSTPDLVPDPVVVEKRVETFDSAFLAKTPRAALPWSMTSTYFSHQGPEEFLVEYDSSMLLVSIDTDGPGIIFSTLNMNGELLARDAPMNYEIEPTEFDDLKTASEEGAGADCENSYPNPDIEHTLTINEDNSVTFVVRFDFNGCGTGSSATISYSAKIVNGRVTDVVKNPVSRPG